MNLNGNETMRRWLPTLLLALAWLVTAAVQWGTFNARITTIEESAKQRIGREEYEARQQDILARLARIEQKVDQLRERR